MRRCLSWSLIALVAVLGLRASPLRASPSTAEPADAVPVLLYHEIDTLTAPEAVTLANFTAQMDYLQQQGYHTISLADYLAWRDDQAHALPSKPILITFDDNHSTNALATAVLQARGFTAVMFVVTGYAEHADTTYGGEYLSWADLTTMHNSGVWQMAFHAGELGHEEYTNNLYASCVFFYPCYRSSETQAQYQVRVVQDIEAGLTALTQHFPDWVIGGQRAFAVPWNDYGQFSVGNTFFPDTHSPPDVLPFLLGQFSTRFAVTFVESPWDQWFYGSLGFRYRYQLMLTDNLEQFAGRLTDSAFTWGGGLDLQPPTIDEFDVSDPYSGQTATTATPVVNVNLVSTDNVAVLGWYLSESASAPDYDQFQSTLTPSFQLSSGGGEKTVYAWTRDFMGNRSLVATTTIALDTSVTPPPPADAVFRECFDIGSGDTDCTDDTSGDSSTVDSINATAWKESSDGTYGTANAECRIQDEKAELRSDCAIERSSGGGGASANNQVDVSGLANLRLSYDWGQSTDNDGGDDGNLVVQWRVTGASTWNTVNTHDLANNLTNDTPNHVDVALTPSPPAGTTAIDLRFHGATTEDPDAAHVDNVAVDGDVVARFSSASSPGPETAAAVSIPVTLSRASSQTVTIAYAVTGGTATGGGTDYTLAAGTLTFTPGQTSRTIDVTLNNDAFDEDEETVVVRLSSPSNAILGTPLRHALTILDDDPTPTVTLSPAQMQLGETGNAQFTVALSAVSGRDVTVNLAYSGTASAGDFTAPSSVVIPAGSSSAQVTLAGIDDPLDEDDEHVIVDISSVINGDESGMQQVNATILDNDALPGVTLGLTGSPMAEAAGTATVTATLGAVSGRNVTVTLAFTGSAAAADYTKSGASIVIPAGSASGSVTLTATQDALDEENEQVFVDIDAVTNGTESGTQRATATITDDDPAPSVTLAASPVSIGEASGVSTVTATLSAVSGKQVTVNLAFSGTAGGSEYTASATSIVIPTGSASGSITVTAVDDTLDEADETVVVDISSVTNGTESGVQQATVTITDNDPLPSVTLGLTGSPLAENGGVATVTAALSAVSGRSVTVNLAFTGAAAAGDYTASGTAILVPAGSLSASITLTGVNDLVDEDAEQIVVDISTVTNGTESGSQQVTATITDDDTAGVSVTPVSGLTTTEAGGSAGFTVVLMSQPLADVTVGISSGDPTEGTVNKSSLVFTVGNWNVPQTVTVTGVNDSLVDGNVVYSVVTAAATSTDPKYNGLNPSDVSVTNTDDDVPGITVTPTSGLTTTEAGGTAAFTVVLTSQPSAGVTIPIASNDATEGSVDRSSLVFDGTNWSTPQTVIVTGVDDDVDDGNVAYGVVTGLAVSADAAYNNLNPSDVALTNTDNDTAGITVTPTSGLTTTEAGGSATFTLVLNSRPTGDVTIALSSSDLTEGTVSPAGVTFTPATWNTPRTVTVTGVDDAVADGNVSYTIITGAAVSGDPLYSGMNPADVGVTNQDNDVPGITVSAITGSTTEAGNGSPQTSTVVLNTQPTANVTIGLSSNDLTEGTVSPASLTFTTVNWDTPRTVTVTGVDDFVDDGDFPYTIVTAPAVSADPNYNNLNAIDRSVTNIDNDTAGITVSAISGDTTTEASPGSPRAFTMVLDSQPIANVTIDVTSSDTTEGTVSGGSGPITNGRQFTFTAGNWSTPQTVTATGVDDFVDDGDIGYTIVTGSAVSTDSGYNGRGVADRNLTNLDDDTAGITVSAISGDTTEASGPGHSQTLTVVLTSQPTASVSIGVSVNGTTEGTVSPASLTFTTANWSTPQTVTATGVDDFVDDGDQPYAIITAPALSADPLYNGRDAANRSLNNIDNDTAGITVSAISGNTTEAGGTATFTAVLDSQPVADVSIAISSSDTTEGTVAPASLAFTAANWSTAQTVTVTGIDDAIDDGDVDYSVVTGVASSSDPKYAGMAAPDRSLSNVDDDGPPAIGFDAATSSSTESTASANLNVVLNRASTTIVKVDYAVTGGTAMGGGTDYTLAAGTLTFAPMDTSEPIALAVVDDALDEADETIVITLSDPVYGSLGATTVRTHTIGDDDPTPDLAFAQATSSVPESQATADLQVTLSAPSGRQVTVDFAVAGGTATGGGTDYGLAAGTLTFAPGEASKLISVVLVNDAQGEPHETVIVTLASPANAGLPAGTKTHTFTILDDDAGITVTPTSGLSTTEAGGTATFTVVLDSTPGANVTIGISSSDTTEGTAAPATLTFTSANWSAPQTVTVTGVDDAIGDGDVAYSIVTAAASSGDPVYNGRDSADVLVTNVDNDTAGVTVSAATGGTTTEAGGGQSFTVKLNSQPAADVTVGISSSDTGEGTVSPATLTFTAANWNTPQTVTVTGVDDAVDDGDQAYDVVIAATASTDPVYNGTFDPADIGMTNTDDDTAGITVSAVSDNTTEAGGTATFTVVLNTQPAADVVIQVSSGDWSEGKVFPVDAQFLTFTAGNWNLPQTVTVHGQDDADDDGDVAYTVVLSPAASADVNYSGVDPVDRSLANLDDDAAPAAFEDPTVTLGALPAYTRVQRIPIRVTGGGGAIAYLVSESATTPSTGDPRWHGAAPTTFRLSNADGLKTLHAWSKSGGGTISAVARRSILFDRKAPRTIITFPANKAKIKDLKNIRGLSTDTAPGSGVSRALVAIRREAGGKCYFWTGRAWVAKGCNNRVWLRLSTVGRWRLNRGFNLPNFDQAGEYSIFARAADRAGNVASKTRVTLGKNWVRFTVTG